MNRLESICLEVNNVCNFSCIHCFQDANGSPQKKLELGHIEKTLLYASALGCRKIILSGGEFFLHPQWFEIVKASCDNFNSVEIMTNGGLLTDKVIKKIQNYLPKLEFTVSMDGPFEDINDRIRGEGSFDLVMNNLTGLKSDFPDSVINIQVVLQKKNETYIRDFFELSHKHRFSSINFLFIQKWGRAAKSWDKVGLSQNRVNILHDIIKETQVIYQEIGCSSFYSLKQLPDETPIKSCNFGKNLYIDSSGQIFGCDGCYDLNDLSLGFIDKTTLPQVFATPLFSKLKNSVKKRRNTISECRECSIADTCAGGCMASAYRETKSLYGEDGFCSERLSYIQ